MATIERVKKRMTFTSLCSKNYCMMNVDGKCARNKCVHHDKDYVMPEVIAEKKQRYWVLDHPDNESDVERSFLFRSLSKKSNEEMKLDREEIRQRVLKYGGNHTNGIDGLVVSAIFNDGEKIEFASIRQASRILGLDRNGIARCLNKNAKVYDGTTNTNNKYEGVKFIYEKKK